MNETNLLSFSISPKLALIIEYKLFEHRLYNSTKFILDLKSVKNTYLYFCIIININCWKIPNKATL